MKALIITLLITLLCQIAWPVTFVLSKFDLTTDQSSVLLAGVVFILFAALGPTVVLKYFIADVDPLMYVLGVFACTCMAGLGVSLELDGYISNFIGFYFVEGEPYMKTAHGTAINYWDGIVHFALCIGIIGLYAARKSHREVGLFWAGSIINSVIVFPSGGIIGKHPVKMSILLNVPYIILPLLALFKFFNERPPQSRTFIKYKSIFKRPADLLFVFMFMAAIAIAVFRGLTASGGNAEAMKKYIRDVEPYIADPNNFPRLQLLVYEYCFIGFYLAAIYGLVYPGKHWLADWALIHAGAAAQGQFSYIHGAMHHRTAKSYRAPTSGNPAIIFWTVNIALALLPQIFAVYCMFDFEKFGRTYNVDRVEFRHPAPVEKKKVKKSD